MNDFNTCFASVSGILRNREERIGGMLETTLSTDGSVRIRHAEAGTFRTVWEIRAPTVVMALAGLEVYVQAVQATADQLRQAA